MVGLHIGFQCYFYMYYFLYNTKLSDHVLYEYNNTITVYTLHNIPIPIISELGSNNML